MYKRQLQSGDTALDLAAVADVFDCTESDVLRTLRYWENQKLVVLAGTDTQTSIDFLPVSYTHLDVYKRQAIF